ncbi:hypothetical protein SOVF_201100 [Spinacia oleracea]|nr:hypothetical protein SOVF_201100 [Spinacia oleracea]
MIEVKNEDEEWNLRSPDGVTIASSSSISNSSCDNATPRSNPLHGRTSGPTRRSTKGGWTEEEDDLLTAAVKKYNAKNWKRIAEHFSGRTDVQCLHRWQKVLNPELVKGPWTKEVSLTILSLSLWNFFLLLWLDIVLVDVDDVVMPVYNVLDSLISSLSGG